MSTSNVKPRTNMYADALQVQNACNLSGVLRSWLEALDTIRAEGGTTGSTQAFNEHPVNVLYADKVYSLCGYGSHFSAACEVAEAKQAT